MWVRDNKVWYEAELIEQIRKIVQKQTNTRMLFADLKSYKAKSYKAFCDIERLIKENEK